MSASGTPSDKSCKGRRNYVHVSYLFDQPLVHERPLALVDDRKPLKIGNPRLSTKRARGTDAKEVARCSRQKPYTSTSSHTQHDESTGFRIAPAEKMNKTITFPNAPEQSRIISTDERESSCERRMIQRVTLKVSTEVYPPLIARFNDPIRSRKATSRTPDEQRHRPCCLSDPRLTASYLDTASVAVSPKRIIRHAAMMPALPFPALQWRDTTLSSSMSSQALALSQKFTTDSKGGQVWSVKGNLPYPQRLVGTRGHSRQQLIGENTLVWLSCNRNVSVWSAARRLDATCFPTGCDMSRYCCTSYALVSYSGTRSSVRYLPVWRVTSYAGLSSTSYLVQQYQ